MIYITLFSSAAGGSAVVWMSLKGKHNRLISATAEAVSYAHLMLTYTRLAELLSIYEQYPQTSQTLI